MYRGWTLEAWYKAIPVDYCLKVQPLLVTIFINKWKDKKYARFCIIPHFVKSLFNSHITKIKDEI